MGWDLFLEYFVATAERNVLRQLLVQLLGHLGLALLNCDPKNENPNLAFVDQLHDPDSAMNTFTYILENGARTCLFYPTQESTNLMQFQFCVCSKCNAQLYAFTFFAYDMFCSIMLQQISMLPGKRFWAKHILERTFRNYDTEWPTQILLYSN